ncbi:acyl-CoA thioesterase [Streptomyces sp. JW3]|uniref:acyl-CoA thioesterase n=1 Tax=Streptomyces sp. JW3 TaxID=3456955 RepID=UPI003FA46823
MDTDAAGHHHNTSVVRFVEAAEAELVRGLGITEYFQVAPRVRYEVDYGSRLWFGQRTTTAVEIEHVGTSSMTLRFEVWGEETAEHPRRLAASGRCTVAHVPAGADRGRPWPAAWRRAFTAGGNTKGVRDT